MPASRSRTHDWRKLLQQIYERGGAIEFAIAHPDRGETDPSLHATGPDLVWRVKVQELTEEEIGVEFPVTLGREVRIDVGTELVAAIAIAAAQSQVWMAAPVATALRSVLMPRQLPRLLLLDEEEPARVIGVAGV